MRKSLSQSPALGNVRLYFRLCMVALLLLLAGCRTGDGKAPRVVHGEVDLQSLAQGEVVALNGDWEFYWDQLLTPGDFQKQPRPVSQGYFSLPSSWFGHHVAGERLGSTGHATYRLRLLTERDSGRLTLRLYDIHEAYRLWADGKLVAQSGVPGRSAKAEMPVRSVVLAEVPLHGHPIELVLQVSNYHFRTGGITEPIQVALPGPLEAAQSRYWSLSLLFAGGILFMAIYHLVLFWWRKKNRAPLYLGLFCLLVVGYSVTSNTSDWVASLLFPWWPPVSMEIFSLSCFICWASLIFRFLKSIYPDEFHSFLLYFLDGRIVVYTLLLVFAPGVPVYWFIALCLVETFLCACYYLARLAVCIRHGRTGARILIVGMLVQFLGGVNDPLAHMGVINSVYLVEPSVFFFILSQALVLSRRYSRAFDSVERLSRELEEKNTSLRQEIDERNRLEQKVVSISEEERRQLSYELHDSLCQQLTGARLRASALAHGHAGDKDGEELAELANLLKTSTQEAYKVARGLCPVEHRDTGPSLKNLVRTIAQATGIKVHLNRDNHCDKCTNENITPLYRIAQEALSNAAKYSRAQNIWLNLQCSGNGTVTLTVRDDGVGLNIFGPQGEGLGTSIMHHRAKIIGADLRIENCALGGTQVVCVAPCSTTTETGSENTHEQ